MPGFLRNQVERHLSNTQEALPFQALARNDFRHPSKLVPAVEVLTS
jgi:hypothetical protein